MQTQNDTILETIMNEVELLFNKITEKIYKLEKRLDEAKREIRVSMDMLE